MEKLVLWFVTFVDYVLTLFKIIKIRKMNGICINDKNCDYLVCENYCNLFNKTIKDYNSLKKCNKRHGLTYKGSI